MATDDNDHDDDGDDDDDDGDGAVHAGKEGVVAGRKETTWCRARRQRGIERSTELATLLLRRSWLQTTDVHTTHTKYVGGRAKLWHTDPSPMDNHG